MLGTGTENDPYIPESWDNFVQAVGENYSYVSVPENTVYDMSQIYNGPMPKILFNCSQLLGHNMKIKNAINPIFETRSRPSDKAMLISNIIFDKMDHRSGTPLFTYYSNYSFSLVITDSIFNGASVDNKLYSLVHQNMNATLQRCSGNIELFSPGASATVNSCFTLAKVVTGCNFTIRVPEDRDWKTDVWSLATAQIYNTVVLYKGPERSYNSSYASVTSGSDYIISYPGEAAFVKIGSSGKISATNAQIRDATWLNQNGFPLPHSEVT